MYHVKLLEKVLEGNYDKGYEIEPLLRDKIENYLEAHKRGQTLPLDSVSVSCCVCNKEKPVMFERCANSQY